MANPDMERRIVEAQTRIIRGGSDNESLNDAVLGAIGWLRDEMERIEATEHLIKIKLDGPKAFAAGGFIVGGLAAAARFIFHV